jgi:hypothetical protein
VYKNYQFKRVNMLIFRLDLDILKYTSLLKQFQSKNVDFYSFFLPSFTIKKKKKKCQKLVRQALQRLQGL